MTLKLFSASLVAAFGLTLTPAQADQVQFGYMSYELETAGGAKALDARLAREARGACRSYGIRSVVQRRSEEACALRLADEWVAGIDSPRLQRIHANARGSYQVAGAR